MTKQQVLKKIENYVINVMKPVKEESHGFRHVDRVRKWALKIGKIEGGVDLFLLEVAALMHDIGRADESANYKHFTIGEKMAREYLPKIKYFTPKQINLLCRAISKHGRGDKSKFIKILQDADRMDGFGAILIARVFSQLYNKPYYIDESSFKIKKYSQRYITNNYKLSPWDRSAIDSIILSFSIYDHINTQSAKKFAKQEIEFLKKFIQQFKKETVDLK